LSLCFCRYSDNDDDDDDDDDSDVAINKLSANDEVSSDEDTTPIVLGPMDNASTPTPSTDWTVCRKPNGTRYYFQSSTGATSNTRPEGFVDSDSSDDGRLAMIVFVVFFSWFFSTVVCNSNVCLRCTYVFASILKLFFRVFQS
jgi:hypothetical protein